MISIDLIATLASVAFVGLLVGTSVLASGGLGPERRADLLERRDPGTAEALRRAQSFTGFASGAAFGAEGFSAVCTPSRRSWHEMARVRAADSDLRVEPPEEALPPMPATVVVLGRGEHVPQVPRPRHPRHAAHVGGGTKRSGHQPTASG